MSITIKTKRFNGGKGEKTIFSSDFCPFEQLGVDIAVLSQLCAEVIAWCLWPIHKMLL